MTDLGPKWRLEGHKAAKKLPGRARGTTLEPKRRKCADFGCLFGAILEPKSSPKPPRSVFEIVEKQLVFYCISGTGGVQEAARGGSENWFENGPDKKSRHIAEEAPVLGCPAGYAGPA